jgi:hypothetical protein
LQESGEADSFAQNLRKNKTPGTRFFEKTEKHVPG